MALPDACALVTADEVAGIVGRSVEARPNPDAVFDPSTQSACSYVVDGGSSGAILLQVTDPGTIDGLISSVDAAPLDGIGDRAYAWDVGSIHRVAVMLGPVVFLTELSTRFYAADAGVSIASIVATRLRGL